ncbi:MAG TPA: hypothetical protein VNF45_04745 [Candidatus Binataceae bacterium]|nr:hypothetical protein [Candidatus Binataceae bacterium]
MSLLPRRHTQICPRCIGRAFSGSSLADPTVALTKLKRIAEILQAIPERDALVFDFAPTLAGAVETVSLLKTMPPLDKLSKAHGSWFRTLVAAGILPEGSRRMGYGTVVLANDGHECLSLGEKTVDDLLSHHGIAHEKEVPYPDVNYRADWRIVVNGAQLYVELFGLDGQTDYTRRMKQKIKFAQESGIQLVFFARPDLANLPRSFEEKILSLFRPLPTDQPA